MQRFTDTLAKMKLPALYLGSSEKSGPADATSEAYFSGRRLDRGEEASGQDEKPSSPRLPMAEGGARSVPATAMRKGALRLGELHAVDRREPRESRVRQKRKRSGSRASGSRGPDLANRRPIDTQRQCTSRTQLFSLPRPTTNKYLDFRAPAKNKKIGRGDSAAKGIK
jgi:hypothetical protein